MKFLVCVVVCVACTLMIGSRIDAQGVQTGTVTGIVTSTDGLSLPGVTVTATSPALQGERVAITDLNGVYSLRGMPAGTYAVTFVIDSFRSARRDAIAVNVGGTSEIDEILAIGGLSETVTVTAAALPSLATTATTQTTVKADIDVLPIGRRPVDIAEFSPGLTTNTFNVGQVSIGGAYGFDNVFMVDGVDTNDNIFGTSNNLFIEDAIEQVTVLAHGIPAAYGRFSGGVVNLVTRSGGNRFSGSVRENLSNPTWIEPTPRETLNGIKHVDVLSQAHEATFGGPVMRDRLWFFSAGRYEKANIPNTFTQTGGAYTRTDTNKRGELKFTGRIGAASTVQATAVTDRTEQANASGIAATRLVDAGTLVTRRLPNRLFVASYSGPVRGTVFATLQYSQKKQRFENNGGLSTAIGDSPFQTIGASAGVPGGLFYHAPYLDATDPEQRNNQQMTGSLAYLLSTSRFGSHDLKGGGEYFVSTGIGGNSQSSTNYVFVTDYAVDAGRPVVDAKGSPVPVFVPGVSQAWNFISSRGATLDTNTSSLYVQDRWIVTPRVTLDLGTRFEMVRGNATGDINTVDTMSIVPRLGAAFDLRGDGRTVVDVTYGHYSGKYSQTQFASNTNVGHPSEVDYVYTGPAGQGSDFAPGFDVHNYTQVVFANFPKANIQVASDLRSPLVREFSAGLARELGSKGYAKVTYARRSTTHFVEDFVSLSNGTTSVPLVGVLTNRVISNSDVPSREYQAMLLQTSYRPGTRLSLGGHYTLQIRDHGNFAGEAANQPGISSVLGDFPEILGPALDRLMPTGRLDSFQRHKMRVYSIVTQPLGRFGSVDVSPIWRVNSGSVYSLTAGMAVPAAQLARNPGYPTNDINPAVRETVYFGERGQYSFKGYGVVDLAVSYGIPVWKSARPWFKVEMYNVMNNQKLIAWDRTVTVDRSSALDANGIPTGYTQGPRFGQATADNQYPQPYPGQNGGRAFRMAFGVRF